MKIRLLLLSAVLLGGCSSNANIPEPTPLVPLESPYSLHKNWEVSLSSLPNLDARGLAFSEDDQAVYIANSEGYVVALHKENRSRWTDQVEWQARFDEHVVSGPTLSGDELLIGTSKGMLKALSKENGGLLWQTQLSSEVISRPTVSGDKIYTRTVDGKLYALNLKDGSVVWANENQVPKLSLRGSPDVLVVEDYVFVAWESGVVQALSAITGELLWETRIASPKGRTDLERIVDIQANLVMKDNRLYALGFHGKLASINPLNGDFYFVKNLSGYRDFVADDKALYAVDEEGVLQAFDLMTGAPLWKQAAFKQRLVGDLHLYGDQLLLSDGWGYLHWVNKLQGIEYARAKHSNEYGEGDRILKVMVEGKRLYVLDGDGLVTSYNVVPSNLSLFRAELAGDDKKADAE
ncbi:MULTISPECIES: outer membrane protein assembly factor BamB [Thiomicrorhabdus]|uniref:Outer membrane protein assembly factor BamB n=1 Tax=Thiomicrorhabdus heinhorstiae TaxID=2748010 RepID=A0ABS0BYD6_9GAMM|nr:MULTISPECIES: outer membrane protein assembly factor BamB [Thiomicrorhabdus]MBF6058807.1 outer membrane protein assembly factor BamB [Thiomicrorhabdus heinhorstiae]